MAGPLQNTLVHNLTWLILWDVSTVFLLDWPRPLLSAWSTLCHLRMPDPERASQI